MLVEIELDERAREYVASQLEVGGMLAKKLRETSFLEHGTLSTFIDPSVPSDLYAWNSGGKLSHRQHGQKIRGGVLVEKTTADEQIVETLIKSSLSRVTSVVSEHVNGRSTDPWLQNSPGRYAIVTDQVMGVTLLSEGKEAILRSVKIASTTWYSLSVWTSASVDRWSEQRLHWGQIELAAVVGGAEFVMIGVYDGESCILWRRRD